MPELLPYEPRTPEWHAARRQGVTATDIVTILGLSSYDSVYSLFWRKMQQIPEVEDSDRFRLGRALETYVLERWEEERAYVGLAEDGALYRHSERAWQMATLDFYVLGAGKPVAVVETKSWADADRHSWDAGPPARVRAQVLWQMDVMDAAAGHVGVVFLPSGEFRSYIIGHEQPCAARRYEPGACDICADLELMREEGETFYRRLRLELPPPDPDSSAATLAAVRARFVKVPAKQAEISKDLFLDWTVYDLAVKGAEQQKRRVEILIREQAGEAAELCVNGQLVARRVVVDAKVKAHTRHQDYLRRVEPEEDDNDPE